MFHRLSNTFEHPLGRKGSPSSSLTPSLSFKADVEHRCFHFQPQTRENLVLPSHHNQDLISSDPDNFKFPPHLLSPDDNIEDVLSSSLAFALPMPDSFDWIFFDCFNTLIDDFDEDGDESGLGPMQHLPVEAGLYDTVYDLRQDYLDWREVTLKQQSREMPIQDRLTALLKRRSPNYPDASLQSLVSQMVACFIQSYDDTIRLPAGVQPMLDYWQGKVSMGVVSNFHVADLPSTLLEKFGLRHYFDFVIDSAQCGYRKPSQEIYAIAASAANLTDYSRVLFIGDHLLNDAQMPQTLGMKSIYFDRSLERAKSSTPPEGFPSIRTWDEFR